MRTAFSALLLGGSLFSPRALAIAQVEELPRGGVGVLEARENRERIEQEKRNRERERERLRPKPSGCATGTICAPRGEGIQSHQVPGSGLVAVLHDIDVEKDALNVRFRFFNDGAEPVTLAIDPGADYEAYFVEVDGTKMFILRDEDGSLQSKKSIDGELEPGSMESWWAKFPPLPPDAASFDVVVPPAPRFEAVPVSAD
jgi:hypothetical protein